MRNGVAYFSLQPTHLGTLIAVDLDHRLHSRRACLFCAIDIS
jgi:hypothetical protein